MSSLEIAELTGKLHKNVLDDIRKMLEELGKTSAEFSANVSDSYGRPRTAFRLPKDLTITLVSGYNVTMRHRIVSRWIELESGATAAAFQLPQTFSEAIRLSADLQEANERLAKEKALVERQRDSDRTQATDALAKTAQSAHTTSPFRAQVIGDLIANRAARAGPHPPRGV